MLQPALEAFLIELTTDSSLWQMVRLFKAGPKMWSCPPPVRSGPRLPPGGGSAPASLLPVCPQRLPLGFHSLGLCFFASIPDSYSLNNYVFEDLVCAGKCGPSMCWAVWQVLRAAENETRSLCLMKERQLGSKGDRHAAG